MEHIGYIIGKNIQLPNYLGMLVEGEDLTEYITLKMKKDETLEGLNYYLTYKNADGAGDTFALTKEITDKEILLSFVVTNAFTAVKGKMEIQVTGYELSDDPAEDDPVWKSFVSTIVIARALHPEEVQPDVPTIFVQYLAQMEAEKLASEGYAKGTQEGVPVTSESPYYHDNAKYWKDKAKDEADYAETEAGYANTSRNEALGFARKAEGYALGEQDGVPVGPESPYYENNSEYFAGYAADQASDAHDFAVDADNARIASVTEILSPYDGGTNTITFTYKDGTVKEFYVTNGHTGKSFHVYKTYASIAAMNADFANVPRDEFVVIASNVTDPDNAKLYYRGELAFEYITDMSGATGAGVPDGGTTGQVLKKVSNTDYDFAWSNEQDISGKADKSEMSVSTSGDKTTITLKSGTSAAVLNSHQDISGKADKVSGATTGNLAKLDSNGNLADSGIDSTKVLTESDVKDNTTTQSATKPLSANMGYSLQQEVNTLKARGRFLSLWNCITGLPVSFPLVTPYTYMTGDYFIVSNSASFIKDSTDEYDPEEDYAVGAYAVYQDVLYQCNTAIVGSETWNSAHWDAVVDYIPTGSSYSGTASLVTATEEVFVNDTYIYDGTYWLHQVNTGGKVAFQNIAGNPTDNLALAAEFANVVKHDSDIPGSATPINADQLNGHADTYFLPKSDVVDTLSSTATDKALSAKQGKVLNDALSDINASLPMLLTSTSITPSTTGLVVNNISKYSVFVSRMTSNYGGGVALGIRYSSSSIRFYGMSQNDNPSIVLSRAELTMNGDTITSVNATLGSSAIGLSYIYGIC